VFISITDFPNNFGHEAGYLERLVAERKLTEVFRGCVFILAELVLEDALDIAPEISMWRFDPIGLDLLLSDFKIACVLVKLARNC
jgi:hypothetical protein